MLGGVIILGTIAGQTTMVPSFAQETLPTGAAYGGVTHYVVKGEGNDPSEGHHLLHIKTPIGIGGVDDLRVKFDFSGMAFTADSSPALYLVGFDADATPPALSTTPTALTPITLRGGLPGDSYIEYSLTDDPRGTATDGDNADQRAILVLAVNEMAVALDRVPMVSSTVAVSAQSYSVSTTPAKAITVAKAFEEMVTATNLVADVGTDFLAFTDGTDTGLAADTKGSLGKIDIGGKSGYRNAMTGAPVMGSEVANMGTVPATAAVPANGQSRVVFSGDFSFASMVTLDGGTAASLGADGEVGGTGDNADTPAVSGALCSTAGLSDMRQTNADGTVNKSATMLKAVSPAYANGRYLCIHLYGEPARGAEDKRMEINPGAYSVTTSYAVLPGGGVAAEGGTASLGMISRNGVSVRIPFLTVNERHHQRLVIMNRGAEARYSLHFHMEEGRTATPGAMASGMLPAGRVTVLSLRNHDVVTIEGGTRTSATLSVAAVPGNISVSTVIHSPTTGNTDTVVLQP